MLDRESTFAEPGLVALLKTDMIPVAIDQAYQRRQKDTEGDFYRRIASQGPRSDFNGTTQGNYVATATGKLLLYNNNRDPKKLLRLTKQALKEFHSSDSENATPLQPIKVDSRYNVSPPVGGLVVRVQAKIMGGYEPTDNRWQQIFQTAVSRDNLWITAEEHRQLAQGKVPDSLAKRIARYHLVDNTRGEPPMWDPDEIKELELSLSEQNIQGNVKLATRDASRGYEAELRGKLKIVDGNVVDMQIVAFGDFWGEGTFTRNAPKGRFPLAIVLTLADGSDIADAIPPQGSRGWVQGYLR